MFWSDSKATLIHHIIESCNSGEASCTRMCGSPKHLMFAFVVRKKGIFFHDILSSGCVFKINCF